MVNRDATDAQTTQSFKLETTFFTSKDGMTWLSIVALFPHSSRLHRLNVTLIVALLNTRISLELVVELNR